MAIGYNEYRAEFLFGLKASYFQLYLISRTVIITYNDVEHVS